MRAPSTPVELISATYYTLEGQTPVARQQCLHRDLLSLGCNDSLAQADVGIPYPWMLGRGPNDVRDLVWHVAASLPRPDVSAGEPWTRARIRLEVHRIIGEQMGIYTFRSRDRLVDDIGIN